MIQQGRSFSGRERHCCFANLQDGTFADVSAISGLDLPEDGRGAALCDWDHDGDLDVWMTNRTGPQVRMFRNNLGSGNDFVAFRLQGAACNRDAIGARVEVYLPGEEAAMIKTLRAGEAFLSQSSKWVHFGLGDAKKVERAVIRWPGGDVQQLNDIETGRRYRVVQGNDSPEVVGQRPKIELVPAPLLPVPASQQASLSTRVGIPLPDLEYRDWDQSTQSVVSGNPTLVILWASWCAPCLDELREVAQHRAALSAIRVDVVALAVDGLTAGGGEDSTAAAQAVLERLEFPFRSGMADARLVDTLQVGNDFIFDLHEPLPVPTSVLLDQRGALQAIFKGPLDVEKFLRDTLAIAQLPPIGTGRRSFSLPFAGRWIVNEPMRESVGELVIGMIKRGYLDEAQLYTRRHRQLLEAGPDYASVLIDLGKALESHGRYAEATSQYRKVLQDQPGHMQAMGRLARLLAACPDDDVRDGEEALRWASKAAELVQDDFAVLDVLAIAQAEHGDFAHAERTAARAIELARRHEHLDVVLQLEERANIFKRRKPYRLE